MSTRDLRDYFHLSTAKFFPHFKFNIRVQETNKADPDDVNSWSCAACTLPIFSTPFKTISSTIHLHDQCAQLPAVLEDHALHVGYPLFLQVAENPAAAPFCSNCKRRCGRLYYHCPSFYCGFDLDILCAREINMMHRSHNHRMMVMHRCAATHVCDACGTQHTDGNEDPYYLCKLCSFWIHHKCASLPNVVLLKDHPHSLFLDYNDSLVKYDCKICGGEAQGVGYFFCPKCSYHVHIKCAMSHPTVKRAAVLIRDVKPSELLRLPVPHEHASLTRYILENSTSTSTSRDEGKLQLQCVAEAGEWELHKHPLVFHNQENEEEDGPHQCNACVQFISPPFYTCSKCPDFYLHDSCLNLPTKIQHPAHEQHTLILHPEKPNLGSHIAFRCRGCKRVCNGFVYVCERCEDICLDVICALMPPAITHESHGKTHILYMWSTFYTLYEICNCCYQCLSGMLYECRSCRDFNIHVRCALLPSTLTHKFDEHPLNLTTNTRPHQICEICEEEDMKEKNWCYSCDKCDQSFHIGCIPCVDRHSKMKLGGSVSVSVRGHDCPCPLKLIRSTTVYGYQCACCYKKFRLDDFEGFAYECVKCYFRVHLECAGRKSPSPFL